MKTFVASALAIVGLAVASWAPAAQADTAEATCQVRRKGDLAKDASGPCTFSQRQGYIDIDLRNGETLNLSPGSQPNHFKDQKGNKVVRTQAGGNEQTYKWENGRKLTVTFGAPAASSGGGNDSGTGLDDLVGARGSSAESELQARGYKFKGNLGSAALWWNPGTRTCVAVAVDEGRVQSILKSPKSDCGK